jgi:hypothetical protein
VYGYLCTSSTMYGIGFIGLYCLLGSEKPVYLFRLNLEQKRRRKEKFRLKAKEGLTGVGAICLSFSSVRGIPHLYQSVIKSSWMVHGKEY